MEGVQLSYGIRVEGDEGPGSGTVGLFHLSRGNESVTGLRGDIALWPAWWSWGGVGPVFGLGAERRVRGTDEGAGGFITLGVEVAMWSRFHWQIIIDADHNFGISSPSRNELRLSVGYAHERLTIGSVHE
jgi:hypothetical protein